MLPISQITLRKWCFLKFSCKEMFSTTCEWCVQHDMQQTSEHFCLRSITKDFSDKICTRKMYLHYFDLVKTAWHLASCMELFVFQVKFFPPCLYRQVLLMNITVSLQILSHERPIYTLMALLTFRNSHHLGVYSWWWATHWCCDVKPTEEVENQDSRDSCEMPASHQPRVVNASRVLTGHPSTGLGMSTGHGHPNYASAPSTQILCLKAGSNKLGVNNIPISVERYWRNRCIGLGQVSNTA